MDYSLFIYRHGASVLFLLIYVDDILIIGNDSKHIDTLIYQLNKQFLMKDLGPLNYFLGIEVHRNKAGLSLTQSKYVLDLLKRTDMLRAKSMSSPAIRGKRLSLYDGEPLSNPSEFRIIVGALQYVTIMRPDNSFAVNQVCQFMHKPTIVHWSAVKRILRYLKNTHNHGLFYEPSSLSLHAYSDADCAGYPDDRHSTSGYCIYVVTNH